ncbi:MAG: phenylacetate--CoA ligase family protein [Candidatus Bathyarchaeota archaeon]|nr:MAG: phenylacetate--CoA ligase family protein [Candidatus Bathyarchaeota archaeon]
MLMHLIELQRNQRLKPSELTKVQHKRLRAIIRHAYFNIKFYHEKFKAAEVKPDDIKTVQDLPKIPVTTKSEVRNAFRAKTIVDGKIDLSKCHLARTSGSSGDPLIVVYDEKAEDFQKAVAVRSFLEAGCHFYDKWVAISSPQRAARKKRWFQRLRLLSPLWLSLFDPPEHHIEALRRIKPDVLEGYFSSIWLIARKMREDAITDIRPRVVIGSAEVLTEKAREFINSTFGVEIYDQFGCVEVGRSAWECEEHDGWHMDVDALAIEFVKDNEQVASGEEGRLLYTTMYNHAMPLIRYDVGDLCIPTDEMCPCGRVLPLIKHIEGRTDDFVTTPDGRVFSPIIWTILMRAIPGIANFRIVQEARSKLTVQLVKDSDFSSKTPSQIESAIQKTLGDIQVKVEQMEELPREKTGKIRSVISKVKVK